MYFRTSWDVEYGWRCISCQTNYFSANKERGKMFPLPSEKCPGGEDHITIDKKTVDTSLSETIYVAYCILTLCVLILSVE